MQSSIKKILDDIIQTEDKQECVIKVLQLIIVLQQLSYCEFEEIKSYIKEAL